MADELTPLVQANAVKRCKEQNNDTLNKNFSYSLPIDNQREQLN